MSRRSGVTLQRLKLILSRQEPPRFGRAYVPSTLATRDEAPAISRPAILQSHKLGRPVHTLSQPETRAALLALYHPFLFELHEQKMLSRWPYPHPMAGLPGIDATALPSVRGTVEVAERLGYLDIHPIVYMRDEAVSAHAIKVPFPYQGDLLLFIQPPNQIPYCVNWPVKDKREAFTTPGPGKRRPDSVESKRSALARYEIEVAYHADASIRTQPIANTDIDTNLAANLCQIFPYTTKSISADTRPKRKQIVDAFHSAMALGVPPMEVMVSLVFRRLCSDYEARVIFFQAIWERELRVDLFRPVLVDYPLEPEHVDVLDRYAHWFAS